ncbi:sensor histidine kinase [Flavisolibacter nicotianae]|uniref:sensor histidine kinase n=1 Tax=Flavisolibacter nicotianae TaxID=2364882 RepID=UPI0013C4A0AB|nr:histidine kinase [Flavisolibacter nicotianae]
MLKDGNKFLWVGSAFGLNRFDGSHFKNYFGDKNNNRTLSGGVILSLVEDSLHNIWIGTNKELARYDSKADTFSNFSAYVDTTIAAPYTIPFWATRNEVFCIEMKARISAYDIHSFKRRTVVAHFQNDWDFQLLRPACSILDERTHEVWMLAKAGLLQVSLATGKQTPYTFPCRRKLKFPGYVHTSQAMCFDSKRRLIWLNTSDGLVQFSLNDRRFVSIEEFDPIVNTKPQPHEGAYYATDRIGLDLKGRVWTGTVPRGILIYDPANRSITQPRIDNVQATVSNALSPAYFDRDGLIWVVGGGKAFYQLNPIRPAVTHFTADPAKPFALSDNHVATIVQGPHKKLWIGTWNGIDIFDPVTGSFQLLREKDLPGFKGKNIMPLAMDSSLQTTWLKAWPPDALFEMDVASRKCRLIQVNDTAWNHRVNLGDMEAERALPFHNGFIFLMQGIGIFRVEKESLLAEPMLSFSQAIIQMVPLGDHFIFLNTPNAAHNLTFIKKSGKWILSPSPLDSIRWSVIFFNKEDQSFWVGEPRDILHLDKDLHLLRRYSEGFPGVLVSSLLADNDGNIWFVNGQNQISKLNTRNGKFLSLSERDGMPKQKFYWEHAHLKDVYGNLYFGSQEGFIQIRPAEFADIYPPSFVYLKAININQKPALHSTGANYVEELSLKHNENNLNIETGIIDYYSEGNSRLRYQLENVNKTWQYGTNPFTINLDGLQPGRYRLVMQASNAVDEFNGPEKILWITIQPPWWGTWWFRGLAVLCLALIFYSLIRWRLHQKFRMQLERTKKEKQLAELQQQKTELEMQALRAQMNPHFIFNSLNSINHFILQNNKLKASEYLTKFSRLVRLILQNSQAPLIPLESELEALQLYLELESIRFDHHFDYVITVQDDIDSSTVMVPPLIIQPYVENAIWHGLMHKEEKGHLQIGIVQHDDTLYCTITDDGVGRQKAAELKSKSASSHKSMGMRITADRIAMLRQKKQPGFYVRITDLALPDGRAGGTEVTLQIPVQYD